MRGEELQVASKSLKHMPEVVPSILVLLSDDGDFILSPAGLTAHQTVVTVLLRDRLPRDVMASAQYVLRNAFGP